MKLQELTTLVGYDIAESLNTKIDCLKWSENSHSIIGEGFIENYKIRIKIDSITYKNLNGLNLTFSVFYNEEPSEKFQNLNIKISSKIIGGVSNALIEKLNTLDFDFVLLAAKDHIQERISLYDRIATKIINSNFKEYKKINEYFKDNGLIIIGKNNVNIAEIYKDFVKSNE